MSEEKDDKPQSAFARFFDAITGRIAKISAGIAVILALIGNLKQLQNHVGGLFDTSEPTPILAPIASTDPVKAAPREQCYKLEMKHPDKMSIRAARSGSFNWSLLFTNQCAEIYFIRVEFKPISDGIGMGTDPDRWPSFTVQAGQERTLSVNPPNVDLLSENPRVIQIVWSIYKTDNQQLLYQDTSQIQLSADEAPVPPGA